MSWSICARTTSPRLTIVHRRKCKVLPGEYTASGTEDAKVIKVDRSKKRLEEYASAYQYRYRAAVEDFEALDPDPDVSWSPEHHSLFDEMHDKYRVIGVPPKATTSPTL